MRMLVIALIFLSAYAVSMDYDSLYTAPATLRDSGYVYTTFCSRSDEARTFTFTADDFMYSPSRMTVDFSGTSSIPDCKQVVVQVTSDEPGMFSLYAASGSDEWVIPVEFSILEPITLSLSKSVVYTGYDTVTLRARGTGRNVWLTVDSSIVGVDNLYKTNLPADFSLIFHFSDPGFYEVPVTLQYERNNNTITREYTFGIRVEEAPIQILGDIRVPSEAYSNLTLGLTLPETIYSGVVSLFSDCLSGSTSQRIENFKSGDVVFKVKGTCDPGIYNMNITAGDFESSVPLEIYGPGGFELFFNTDQNNEEHSIEVLIANKDSETMKSVSVRLLEGDYKIVKEGTFLGDLEFGDFDSAELDFIPSKKSLDINLKLSYTKGGERVDLIEVVPYDYQVKSNTSTYLAILLVIAVGAYYVKTRKARS